MAVTNDTTINSQMVRLRSHGITRDPAEMNHAPDGPWDYPQIDLGFNYHMTDLQAALGLSQMQQLDELVTKRHIIAKRYDQLLANFPLITPLTHADSYSGLHLYVIRLKSKRLAIHIAKCFRHCGHQVLARIYITSQFTSSPIMKDWILVLDAVKKVNSIMRRELVYRCIQC